jgi:hypothetical protein
MVMDLDLEEMTVRKEKSRTDSSTGVLGIGFNPNRHNKGRKQEKATRSGVREAHGQAELCRLADIYFVVGVQVIAHAGKTQD